MKKKFSDQIIIDGLQYCNWNRELFEDVWRNQPYKNIGPIRADLIFTAQNNQVQRNAFNKKYARNSKRGLYEI